MRTNIRHRRSRSDDVSCLLLNKNFASRAGISHIGLGVSAILTAKYLNANGLRTQVVPIVNPVDLGPAIETANAIQPVTHVVVAAPWIPTAIYANLCQRYPHIHFAMNCHSNVGFLQADASGAQLFREALELEQGTHNFHATGNSSVFASSVEITYGRPCGYLPNLYYLDDIEEPIRPGWSQTGGVLRIGVFGAIRAQKNVMTAVWAAMEISSILKAQTEIWLSTAREDDQAARMILKAVRALTANMPNVRLVESPWTAWPQFRKIVGSMHLLIQVSYTESFNIVTADGCAEGVPSVVSSAINWAPPQWFAEVDDAHDVAAIGISALCNPYAPRMGLSALRNHNSMGLMAWQDYLTGTRP